MCAGGTAQRRRHRCLQLDEVCWHRYGALDTGRALGRWGSRYNATGARISHGAPNHHPSFAHPVTPTFWQMRGFAHKPVETRVLLVALLGTESTHPKVAEAVRAAGFFSWSKKRGSSTFIDHAMEAVNNLQVT